MNKPETPTIFASLSRDRSAYQAIPASQQAALREFAFGWQPQQPVKPETDRD